MIRNSSDIAVAICFPKGQLISKCPFCVFKSPEKTTKGFLP